MRRSAEVTARDVALTQIEEHMENVLQAMGLDLEEEGLNNTPQRVAKFLMEFRNAHDYDNILSGAFEANGHHSLVAQRGIPFRMLCEHHLAPALGKAAVGYIPGERVIGLSKITRLVQAVGTERPSLQEYIGDKIAELLYTKLRAQGVIVVIKAEHSCMAARGVNSPGVLTITSSIKGLFRDVPALREEFFNVIREK
jgi:GTP cyclohydrolase I